MPIKVTFDKNVYEFVVNPRKSNDISPLSIEVYSKINRLINEDKIIPFVSETIFTYETIGKLDRFQVLSHNKPIVIVSEDTTIKMSSNAEFFPDLKEIDKTYISAAINMGFRILPGKRFGKLVNPFIKPEWYYYLEEDYMITAERFSEIVSKIESLGGGYKQFEELITTKGLEHLPRFEKLKHYNGKKSKLNKAVAEWSDGDSAALHITYNIDFFCTYDKGKGAGEKSVFNNYISSFLKDNYNFKKGTPDELIDFI